MSLCLSRCMVMIGLLSSVTMAATFEIIPVRSTQGFEIAGNTILISPGAQRILFDVRLSGWGPGLLRVYQVGLSGSLLSDDPSRPALALQPPDGSACATLFGSNSALVPLCQGGERAHRSCFGGGSCPGGSCVVVCEPVFVDLSRPDFVFSGQSVIAATSFAEAVLFGAVPLTGSDRVDPGEPRYVGTIVLDVPAGWIGEWSVGFADDPEGTLTFLDSTGDGGQPLVVIPARITMRCEVDADCDDQNVCTDDVCDVEANQCRFVPTFDDTQFCCDRETGILKPLDDDANECTTDRCTTGETTHTFAPAGTVCGNHEDDVCDSPDTCNGFGFCIANHTPAGTDCGPPPKTVCGRTPRCDGNGACVAPFAPPLTPCGIPGFSTICGGDFCDGAGNCVFQFAPAGGRCRAQQPGTCDLPDECDGAGNCMNLSRPTGTPCASVNECELGACDGSGSCRATSFSVAGTACRPADPCERGVCDGSGTCQATVFAGETTVCVSVNQCERGFCDGSGSCQTTHFAAAGSVCTPVNQCETGACDGHGSCQATAFTAAGTVCGSGVTTTCNPGNACDGLGHCQSSFAPAGTACVLADACERGSCDGSGACQVTSFAAAGTPCGSAANSTCNRRDVCDGLGQCSQNFAPPGTPCGNSGSTTCNRRDVCDDMGQCSPNFAPDGTACEPLNPCETGACDGRSGTCRATSFAAAGTACASINECETRACDGGGSCQFISYAARGTACGNRTGTECDRPDECDGAGVCLSKFASYDTPCGSQATTQCSGPDRCDGQGSCSPNHYGPSHPCGDPSNRPCDNADSCDGAGNCRDNLLLNGSSCSDGLYCNGAELCFSHVCQAGIPPCGPGSYCREETDTCELPPPAFYVFPPDGSSLWRQAKNEVRIYQVAGTVGMDPPLPGEILIQEMLPEGAYGPDLSSRFSFTIRSPGLFAIRELVIREEIPTFTRRTWYAVRSVAGWPEGHSFLYEFLVQVGDANGDRFVSAVDLAKINANVPSLKVTSTTLRADITGDGKVGAADLSAAYGWLPSLPVSRPSGH